MKVVWTRAAVLDLAAIRAYIERDRPDAAAAAELGASGQASAALGQLH
ncbi:MAG: hypothetical protein HY814_09125 [Candidatus Riflebacteria bacterium]|nr:hypothetical protein [Candidatus Riflebacteria bacterium]